MIKRGHSHHHSSRHNHGTKLAHNLRQHKHVFTRLGDMFSIELPDRWICRRCDDLMWESTTCACGVDIRCRTCANIAPTPRCSNSRCLTSEYVNTTPWTERLDQEIWHQGWVVLLNRPRGANCMNIPWGPFDPQDHPRPSSQGEFFKMMQEASLVEFGRYRNAFVQEYDVDPETHPMLGSVLTLPPDYPHSVLNGVTVYELRGLPDSVANNPELATFRATSSIYMLRGLKDKPEFLAIPLLTSRFMDKDRRLLIPEEMSIAVVDIENTANPVSFTKVQVESVVPAIQQPVNLKPARYQLVFVVEDKTVGQYMPKLDSAPVKEAALSQGASKDNLSAESGELQSLAKELDSLLSQAIARTETAKSEFVEPEASLPAKMLYPKTVVRKELVRKDVLNSAYLPVPYKARFQISPQTLKGFFIEPTFRVKIDSFPSHNADPVIYQLEGLPQCVISRHDLAGLTTTSPVYLLENFNGVGKTTINLEISSPRSARKRIAYINMDDASAPVIFNAELKKCTPHPSIKNKENIYTQTAVLPSVWYQLVFAVKSTTNTDSSSGVEGRECISHHRHETERMQARVTWKWDSSGSRDPVENMETGGVRS